MERSAPNPENAPEQDPENAQEHGPDERYLQGHYLQGRYLQGSDDALTERLRRHVEAIAQPRDPFFHPLHHRAVQIYLRSQLSAAAQRAGLPANDWPRPHPFSFRGQSFTNWSLDLPPLAPPPHPRSHRIRTIHQPLGTPKARPILIAAHFDSVPTSPGADDNASGLAVALELAHYFATHPCHHPLRFVAFDLEEYGVGSRAYVQDLQAQGEPLRLMLCLEMLGYRDRTPGSQRYPAPLGPLYPNTGDFIALIGNLRTLPTLLTLQRQFLNQATPCQWLPIWNAGQFLPDSRRSDHAAFWDAGYNAILVTDTANLRNPHYHQPSDIPATLDWTLLTQVCQGLRTAIPQL